MKNFYEGIPVEQAGEIESLSRLMYELRSNRDLVLQNWGVTEAQSLLAKIESGEVAEHPAYEHYLSACVLDQTRESVRESLVALTREVRKQ